MEITKIFVDLTDNQQVERMKKLVDTEFINQHQELGTKYLIFDMHTTLVEMVVGADNIIYTDDNSDIIYVGINDIDVVENDK